jgi:hypothetical protein
MNGRPSPGGGWEFFFSPPCPDRLWGPPSLLSNGYQELFPWGVKWPGSEADHSPPSSAEVRMRGAIPPLPQYVLMARCSVKTQGQLYFYPLPINEKNCTLLIRSSREDQVGTKLANFISIAHHHIDAEVHRRTLWSRSLCKLAYSFPSFPHCLVQIYFSAPHS